MKLKVNKCRIVFFDLEFYVPESSRVKTGLCYNPWDKKCKLLGGSFLVANPENDFQISEGEVLKKTESFWLWDFKDERELLVTIYELLKKALLVVHNAHQKRVSPLLCGIGISSSDVPILIELFKRYQILSNAEAFKFQSHFRVIDLSQLAIACFNNSNEYLYPKVKNDLLRKYIPNKNFASGKSVWNLYETGKYGEINSRVVEEIAATHALYKYILSDYRKFKRLEKNDKTNFKLEDQVS
ncbi:hypothetical protein CWC04_18610 [Pseudoalteromonas sp. S2893]|nr:hypothetical protein CWC04_18610 [Pseudoalteromonas sp. S2893]